MNEAEEFFYQHAGYSYDPSKETEEEGRRRCAADLASAEAWAATSGLSFSWEPDFVTDHVSEFPDAYTTEPETCEGCIAHAADGEVIASLWCIDDADSDYRRVIEAELALEARDES